LPDKAAVVARFAGVFRLAVLPFQLGRRFSRKAPMRSCASAAIEFMAMTDFVKSYAPVLVELELGVLGLT
jgi:hypothetical protein